MSIQYDTMSVLALMEDIPVELDQNNIESFINSSLTMINILAVFGFYFTFYTENDTTVLHF